MNNNMDNFNLDNMSVEELEKLKKELAGKSLKIDDSAISDRNKSFVETMSSEAMTQKDVIQRKREERYEEMISEVEELESPISRLH